MEQPKVYLARVFMGEYPDDYDLYLFRNPSSPDDEEFKNLVKTLIKKKLASGQEEIDMDEYLGQELAKFGYTRVLDNEWAVVDIEL